MKPEDKPKEENCAVHELHFEDCYIQCDYTHVNDGKEVRIARGMPGLTSDVEVFQRQNRT